MTPFQRWNQTEGARKHIDGKSGGLDIGYEGIDVSHWEHVLIVNRPRAYANVHPETTLRLMRNPSAGAT